MVAPIKAVNPHKALEEDIASTIQCELELASSLRGTVMISFTKDRQLRVKYAGDISYLELMGACELAKQELWHSAAEYRQEDEC